MSHASRNERHRPRLYLITPVVDDAKAFAPALEAAVEGVAVAALLLRLADTDERTLLNRIKHLAPIAQERGTAVLLDGRPELVARGGADGAHLAGVEALRRVREILPPDRIAGAGGLDTRHDAMVAGELGADYVMFGEPDARGHTPPMPAVLERTRWWAEVFEPACVAVAPALETVAEVADAGADFVALGRAIWDHPAGIVAAVREAAAILEGDRVP